MNDCSVMNLRKQRSRTDEGRAKERERRRNRRRKKNFDKNKDSVKLEHLTKNFNSSPYPQETAGVIEELEHKKQLSDRKARRQRERKHLKKERKFAKEDYQKVVSHYHQVEREVETTKRGWMDEKHQSRSLLMRKIELDEIKRKYDYERDRALLLKARCIAMEKEDRIADRVMKVSLII